MEEPSSVSAGTRGGIRNARGSARLLQHGLAGRDGRNLAAVPLMRLGGLSTGWVLTVAAELDLLASLLAVLAAVLPERTLRFDDALTRGVSALRC
jgi:hypothetical protein